VSIDSLEKARKAARLMLSKKARELSILDVRALTSFADYFVIASGRSARQVQAIAEHAMTSLKKEGLLPLGVEGLKENQWVLLDYGDVVIHVFYDPIREFYDLDGLWGDAGQVAPVEDPENGSARKEKVQ